MADEQIKQNAEAYAGNSAKHLQQPYEEYKLKYDAYIAGAHSRDEEIEELRSSYHDMFCILANKVEQLRNPWISVEDRLPEKTKALFSYQVKDEEEDKLVFYKDTYGYIHTGYFNAKGYWCDYARDNGVIYKVTHWMPTHELKKGE